MHICNHLKSSWLWTFIDRSSLLSCIKWHFCMQYYKLPKGSLEYIPSSTPCPAILYKDQNQVWYSLLHLPGMQLKYKTVLFTIQEILFVRKMKHNAILYKDQNQVWCSLFYLPYMQLEYEMVLFTFQEILFLRKMKHNSPPPLYLAKASKYPMFSFQAGGWGDIRGAETATKNFAATRSPQQYHAGIRGKIPPPDNILHKEYDAGGADTPPEGRYFIVALPSTCQNNHRLCYSSTFIFPNIPPIC